jgi:hypothetical protein
MSRWLLSLAGCVAFVLVPVCAESSSPEELFVPILINGRFEESRHYQTIFRFLEFSGTTASPAVSVQVDAFDNSGAPIHNDQLFCPPALPLPGPLQVSLAGQGSTHFGTKGFIQLYEPGPGAINGWVRLRVNGPGRLLATAEVLQVDAAPSGCPAVVCSRPSQLYRSDAVVHAVKPAKAFRAAAVVTSYRHTAFAVVNPSETDTAHVSLQLLRPDGTVLQAGEDLAIAPMKRVSAFAWEWATVPQALLHVHWPEPDNFYGSARIVSDVPVVVGALQVLFPESKVVSASVTPEP